MVAQRIAPRFGDAAHHIVAGRARAAALARAILARFQVNINDAGNGVFLPTRRVGAAASGRAYHPGLHTNRYYRAVNEALSEATSKEQVIAILRDIAAKLQTNSFPH